MCVDGCVHAPTDVNWDDRQEVDNVEWPKHHTDGYCYDQQHFPSTHHELAYWTTGCPELEPAARAHYIVRHCSAFVIRYRFRVKCRASLTMQMLSFWAAQAVECQNE